VKIYSDAPNESIEEDVCSSTATLQLALSFIQTNSDSISRTTESCTRKESMFEADEDNNSSTTKQLADSPLFVLVRALVPPAAASSAATTA
jgi:hypothetical protein